PTRHHTDALAVELLLDQAVDLVAPPDAVTQRAWLLAALEEVTTHGQGSELVVAVVGALDTRTLGDLARIGTVHDAWALVRAHPAPTLAEEQTLRGLRRAGWAATFVRPGEPVTRAWQRMIELAGQPSEVGR
ncbi:MAG TPA: hypothetical protein PKB06_10160, partial [Actinotalea sp.]|nr:hypothetical protein [Actinotalea sp.]